MCERTTVIRLLPNQAVAFSSVKRTIIAGEIRAGEKAFSILMNSHDASTYSIAHADMFPLLSAENNMLPSSHHYELSTKICVLISTLMFPHPAGETQHWADVLHEAEKGRQADICTELHHITSLFYHAIPWNETSGIEPAFSRAVEKPSGEWAKA